MPENKNQTDSNASAFLRAARGGNMEKVLEYLKGVSGPGSAIDINISNANGLNALHLASKEGHVELVDELLQRNANVNAATKKGNTALHIASLAGQFEIVKILVDSGADVNAQSQNGFTPLYMASQENHEEVVRYLVDHNANPTITTEDGFTPLAVALQQGHEKVVSILLEKEASYKDTSRDETLSNGTGPTGQSTGDDKLAVKLPALHIAAKKDDCKAADYLLKNGSDPNVTSKSGFTPLHIAAHYGNDKVGQLLIEHHADINFKARHDITPLHVASRWGKVKMVELLLKNGADIDSKTRDGLTPLHCAARSGHDNVIKAILEHGAQDPNAERIVKLVTSKTKNGLSPLHMASQGNHVKCAELLLRYGAPVDDITVDYLTSLHICAHYGNVETAKLLLDHLAEVDARALNGFTPLHIACKKNRLKIVELLLSRRAGIMCTTESGLTPLHVACFMGHVNIVIYLLNFMPLPSDSSKGAEGETHLIDVDAKTVRGETPLHLAARANQTDIMRILLRKGATVDCRARENQTPLHIAARLGNTDTASLLLQHGASPLAKTTDDYTPIHLAVKEGHPETLGVLLERISDPAALNESLLSKKGFAPLHLSAKAPNDQTTAVARVLLEKGANVDVLGKNDVTPLHVATHYDKPGLVTLLLEHGADPLARANNGYTALHIAAKKNPSITIASMLVAFLPKINSERGPGTNYVPDPQAIDCRSRSGFTPLHLAAQAGNADMTAYLLKCGADPLAASNNGLTPLHLAAQNDNVDCMALLCKAVTVNLPTKEAQDRALKEIVNFPTVAGYTPLHTASHYGRLNAVRFLLNNGADPSIKTKSSGYTAMHQAAQQGHSTVVNLLLQHNASPDALTNQGQTALSIAQKLGYVSLIETLKVVTETIVTTTTTTTVEEKYKLLQPETMQENYISDSEDEPDVEKSFKEYIPAYYEGGLRDITADDTIMGDTSYRYLTSEQMKSLGDDSNKILDQEPSIRLSALERSQGFRSDFSPEAYDKYDEEMISPTQLIKREEARGKEAFIEHPNILKVDNITPPTRPPVQSGFLVSFMVDARGGAMRGCRHSGVRIIIPPRKAQGPVRVTCRFLKREKMANPPPLIEGEGLACRVLELGPAGTKFLGPVIIEVPHYASLAGNEREITILRSDNGETWREHILEASESAVQEVLNESFDGEDTFDDLHTNRITRILTNEFPLYFAIVSRIHQETHTIGPDGGIIRSSVVPLAQAMFPEGALTKRIRIGLQAHPIHAETVTKLLGNRVAVSPVVTIEPRRRKFHKPITLTIPLPQATSKGMINQYNNGTGAGEGSSTLRLLCSITGGVTPAQWEDITGSTPLTFVNDYISFTTTVSARFWLIDCRQIGEVSKFATDVYNEATKVPYMTKIVVYGKRDLIQPSNEAHLRAFMVTDDRGMDKTLEYDETFREIAQSREVEVIDSNPVFLEMIGNLVQITKSDASRFLEDQILVAAKNGSQGPASVTTTPATVIPPSFSSISNLNHLNYHNVLAMRFVPFQENRLPFKVRIKDPNAEPIGRLMFLSDPPNIKLSHPVQPICTLNITIPEENILDRIGMDKSILPDKIRDIQNTFKDIEIAKEVMHPDLMLDTLSRSLNKDWETLATSLDFNTHQIETIKNEFPNNLNHQAKAFIITWRHKLPESDDSKEFKRSLERALKDINRGDIIDQFSSIKKPELPLKFSQSTLKDGASKVPAVESPEIRPTLVDKGLKAIKKVSDSDKLDKLKQFAADTAHVLPKIPKKLSTTHAEQNLHVESPISKEKLKDKQHLPPTNEVVIDDTEEPRTPTPSRISSPKTEEVQDESHQLRDNRVLQDTARRLSEQSDTEPKSPKSSTFTEAIYDKDKRDTEMPLLLKGHEGETTLRKLRITKQTKTRTIIKDGQEQTQTVEETLFDDGGGKPLTFEELSPELQIKVSEFLGQDDSPTSTSSNQDLVIEEVQ